MIIKIFAVRDKAVEAFLQPFFSPTNGSALRSFKEAVNDPKHQFHSHCADYSLWLLGDYDDATGGISAEPPAHIINGVDLLGID